MTCLALSHLSFTSPLLTSHSFLVVIFFNLRMSFSFFLFVMSLLLTVTVLYSNILPLQPCCGSCTALMKTHVMPSCTNCHDKPAGKRERRNERWGEEGRLIDSDREKRSKRQERNQENRGGGDRVKKEERGRLATGEKRKFE